MQTRERESEGEGRQPLTTDDQIEHRATSATADSLHLLLQGSGLGACTFFFGAFWGTKRTGLKASDTSGAQTRLMSHGHARLLHGVSTPRYKIRAARAHTHTHDTYIQIHTCEYVTIFLYPQV